MGGAASAPRLFFGSKAEFDEARASGNLEELRRRGFKIVEFGLETRAAGPELFDDLKRLEFQTEAEFDECRRCGFESKAEYDECMRRGFATKAEFEEFKSLGFETKAEYDECRASGILEEQRRLGFETKTAYEECKRLGFATSFKGKENYDACKRLGYKTKAEYDAAIARKLCEEAVLADDKRRRAEAELALSATITKSMGFEDQAEFEECRRCGFQTKAEYEESKCLGFENSFQDVLSDLA